MSKTLLPGYIRGGPFSRGYISPSGVALSYRDYRKLVEESGRVRHLSAEAARRVAIKRQEYQDIVNTMAKVKKRSLVTQLEILESQKRPNRKLIEETKKELRTVKQTVIRSGVRKEAVADLKKFSHPKVKTEESIERTKTALKALGRRDGIKDWVPPGLSDEYRRGVLRSPKQLTDPRYARFLPGYQSRGISSGSSRGRLTAANSNRSRRK